MVCIDYTAAADPECPLCGGLGTVDGAVCRCIPKETNIMTEYQEFSPYENKGFGLSSVAPNASKLAARHGVPPFSVLNSREGDWQERKRLWLKAGKIQSELGRDVALFNITEELSDGSAGAKLAEQASIFDPVVCEICYRWWCKPGGTVLDPFAGGSVRGIVASMLNYRYLGVELRPEQVEANRGQLNESNTGAHPPKWKTGDSHAMMTRAPEHDFFFSCPPYGNLEKYSDDPNDISNMTYDQFLGRYREIIAKGLKRLRPNRFACFVVANYRSKEKGREMLDFVGDTITAFEDGGAKLYNDVILINSVGTGAMRCNTNFVRGNRKVVKTHQNILVFVKGDPKIAAADIPVDDGK